MANLLYVDNSNVWIEGMHVAAAKHGHAPNVWAAVQNRICDYNWKLDFGKLFAFAGGDRANVKRAALFGSRPPQNDSLWVAAERTGFEVVVYDRNVANHEKKIDTDIVATMIEDSYERVEVGKDEITGRRRCRLRACDREAQTARHPRARSFLGPRLQGLKETATKFVDLDPYLEHLGR